MKEYSLKVKNGKFIKLSVEVQDGRIKSLKISGDFFFYPEEDLFLLEKKLINKKQNNVPKIITDFINKRDIKILGFDESVLISLLTEAFKNDVAFNR